ncbi:MAG: transposase [Deinococcus sp.]|nr:transposase [Deinococcus sp.]
MNQRRKFSPAFKAQVVLEVVAGVKSPAQAGRDYQIKDSLLSQWKQEFLAHAPRVFEPGKAHDPCAVRIAALERLVGRLTLELEMAKKAALLWSSARTRNGSW